MVLGTALMLIGENSRSVSQAVAARLEEINRSLHELLIDAIRYGDSPEVQERIKEVVDKERAIYVEQAKAEPRNAGKSDEILAKASEGRLRKEFFGSVVLMSQVFVIDGKATVAEAVKAANKND